MSQEEESSSSTDDERNVEDEREGADQEDDGGAGEEESQHFTDEDPASSQPDTKSLLIMGKVMRELTKAREAFDDYADRDTDGQPQQSAVERISRGRLLFFRTKPTGSSSDHSEDEESVVEQDSSRIGDESLVSHNDVSNHTAVARSIGVGDSNEVATSVRDLLEEPIPHGAYSVTRLSISTAEESNANLIDDTDYSEPNRPLPAVPDDPESGLARATRVPDTPVTFPQPELEHTSSERAFSEPPYKTGGCFVVVLVVLAVCAIHFIIRPTPEIPVGTQSPAGAPTSSSPRDRAYLLSLLPDYTIKEIHFDTYARTFFFPSLVSPQTKAFIWTINDPNFDYYETWQLKQRFALACFYYATGGETSWKSTENWLSYKFNESDWYSNHTVGGELDWHDLLYHHKYGIFEETSHQLNHLWLVNNSLEGTIPPELSLLTSLRSIDLSANPRLRGPIPSEIGNLHRLEILMFSENTMTGELPTELGQLTKLLSLKTENNTFHGTIPSQLSMLKNMTVLELGFSGLGGQIPSELGLITPLGIYFEGNELESTIPTELGLTSDHILSLHSNMLTGTIPSELGMLLQDTMLYKPKFFALLEEKAPKGYDITGKEALLNIVAGVLQLGLNGVMMSQNLLTGSIPTELGRCAEGVRLDLAQNSLTGAIPSELGLLSNLLWLFLSENQLQGQIPSELGLLSNAKYLLLHQNDLTGSLPHELGSLNLTGLTINSTGVTGTIPEELCDLGRWNISSWEGLAFDCSEDLCGCSWCPCTIV
ncbi:LRR receptor-like serine threonine-protein kinase [Seminavis robusta]|uniref:LRR receptor-like serine threonine-protein kinase n=1 Tax=Seminavis robusta TaxID=568900 RepID=A0A9N8DX21_9STRA|nr:LRR receptor-like serine threonine-protein kinase [Seminavis robusta]|eukprot:Sro409_g137230.1 LRR receptor-like serine threonine-protein kinase (766) ;mRNA; r:47487-49784